MKTPLITVLCSMMLVAVPCHAGLAQAKKAPAATSTVVIDNFTFNAKTITVRTGTVVTWVNRDDVPHKVVSTDGRFSSPVLDTDGRFSFTFSAAGAYGYYCSIHPMMTGTVIVKD